MLKRKTLGYFGKIMEKCRNIIHTSSDNNLMRGTSQLDCASLFFTCCFQWRIRTDKARTVGEALTIEIWNVGNYQCTLCGCKAGPSERTWAVCSGKKSELTLKETSHGCTNPQEIHCKTKRCHPPQTRTKLNNWFCRSPFSSLRITLSPSENSMTRAADRLLRIL